MTTQAAKYLFCIDSHGGTTILCASSSKKAGQSIASKVLKNNFPDFPVKQIYCLEPGNHFPIVSGQDGATAVITTNVTLLDDVCVNGDCIFHQGGCLKSVEESERGDGFWKIPDLKVIRAFFETDEDNEHYNSKVVTAVCSVSATPIPSTPSVVPTPVVPSTETPTYEVVCDTASKSATLAPDTVIITPDGEVPVSELVNGDVVVTATGVAEVQSVPTEPSVTDTPTVDVPTTDAPGSFVEIKESIEVVSSEPSLVEQIGGDDEGPSPYVTTLR